MKCERDAWRSAPHSSHGPAALHGENPTPSLARQSPHLVSEEINCASKSCVCDDGGSSERAAPPCQEVWPSRATSLRHDCVQGARSAMGPWKWKNVLCPTFSSCELFSFPPTLNHSSLLFLYLFLVCVCLGWNNRRVTSRQECFYLYYCSEPDNTFIVQIKLLLLLLVLHRLLSIFFIRFVVFLQSLGFPVTSVTHCLYFLVLSMYFHFGGMIQISRCVGLENVFVKPYQ